MMPEMSTVFQSVMLILTDAPLCCQVALLGSSILNSYLPLIMSIFPSLWSSTECLPRGSEAMILSTLSIILEISVSISLSII